MNESEKTENKWISFEIEFEENDVVEHKISGEKGVVVAFRYYSGNTNVQYCVSFNAGFSEWFQGYELVLYEKNLLDKIKDGIGFGK
jgi:hypothetical protein